MKNIIKALEKQLDYVNKKVLDRVSVHDNRTENWQESEKGETYSYCTEELEDISNELFDVIDKLKDWNNDQGK